MYMRNVPMKYARLVILIFIGNWNTTSSQILKENILDPAPQSNGSDYMTDGTDGILMDPMLTDDHEEFELADIIASSEAFIDYDQDVYSNDDRQYWVDVHNVYRSNQTEPIVKAANMKMMEYNRVLEWGAHEYLKECRFAHGRAKVDNMSRVTSQNLYSGHSNLITRYMYLWYREYQDYFFHNNTCRTTPSGQVKIKCGHFTQIMWANSNEVGCARRSHCYPRTNRILVACHYHPQGNWAKKELIEMYSYGMPCTRSDLRNGNLCHKNLCVTKKMCQDLNLDCTCELNCQNCARPNFRTCRCECKKGWDYGDCGVRCDNLFTYDERNVIRAEQWCSELVTRSPALCKSYYYSYKCRKTCGLCSNFTDEDNPDDLCCKGRSCDRYSGLDTTTCECRPHCPTYGCLYKLSNTTVSTKVSFLEFRATPSSAGMTPNICMNGLRVFGATPMEHLMVVVVIEIIYVYFSVC